LEEAGRVTAISVTLDVDGFHGTLSPRDVPVLTERLRRRMGGAVTQPSLPALDGGEAVHEDAPGSSLQSESPAM
jgi:hypothetical protein